MSKHKVENAKDDNAKDDNAKDDNAKDDNNLSETSGGVETEQFDIGAILETMVGPRNVSGEMITTAGHLRRRMASFYDLVSTKCNNFLDNYQHPEDLEEDDEIIELDAMKIKTAAITIEKSLNSNIKKPKKRTKSSQPFDRLTHYDRKQKLETDALYSPLYILALVINLYKLNTALKVAIDADAEIDKSEYPDRGWPVYNYEEVDTFCDELEGLLSSLDFLKADDVATKIQAFNEEFPEIPEAYEDD